MNITRNRIIAIAFLLMPLYASCANEKSKNIVEYYNLLPISKNFPITLHNGKYYTKSPVRPGPEEIEVLVDITNGYIQFSINGWGHGDDYQAALFLDKDKQAYIAINSTGKEGPLGFVSFSQLNIYKFQGKNFNDVTLKVFPAITKSMFTRQSHDYSKLIDTHSQVEPIQFILPRHGTDIISQLGAKDFIEAIYKSEENMELLNNFLSDIAYNKIQIKWDKNTSRFIVGKKY